MGDKSVVPATQTDLQKLHDATNKAIKSAHRFRRKLDGPINWADLHCIETRMWVNNHGDAGLSVYIEEAEPGCNNDPFCEYIRTRLAKLGFPDIEVNTEW